MLIISRRVDETIVIDGPALIKVIELPQRGRVLIGIDAPKGTHIWRGELLPETPEVAP